jgi:hypothetical protein
MDFRSPWILQIFKINLQHEVMAWFILTGGDERRAEQCEVPKLHNKLRTR